MNLHRDSVESMMVRWEYVCGRIEDYQNQVYYAKKAQPGHDYIRSALDLQIDAS